MMNQNCAWTSEQALSRAAATARRMRPAAVCWMAGLWLLSGAGAAELPERVDFNWHVKPLLSDRCFVCHGPDANNRQADLRLDTREGLFAALEYSQGTHVVRPGDLEQSELHLRIAADDDSYRMPPADSNLSLSETERRILSRWIEQGAQWKEHWSLLPLSRPEVPAAEADPWAKTEIDAFVLQRLRAAGLRPAPESSRERLIRRLSFDLTGLPPTPEEVDAFLADDAPDAYQRLVDRLLASPRFGERMAVDWLDTARYADTYGYQADVYRAVWPYRDWVIGAFNDNLPYDQFITWQLAGDLVADAAEQQPESSRSARGTYQDAGRQQRIATAFNRLHRQTNEGGSIEEEFRAEYVADRTNTFGSAFLGLTLECARCHDHKYDSISQADYYRLFAFFNNLDESGLYSHFTDAMPTPTLLLTDEAQQAQIAHLEQQIRQAEQQLAELAATRRDAFRNWLADRPAEPEIGDLIGDYPLETIADGQLANRVEARPAAKAFESPETVPGRIGNALKLSGENNVTTKVGGDFTRDDAFSVALWIRIPDHKQRAVIFHRSRAWTDAGSRGYELLIEDGCLSAGLIHFWPGNAIGIRARQPAPTGRWLHVVLAYDGSSRAEGLTLYVDGQRADCEVVRDNLYKNITGGGADELTLGQRFRDRGFKDGLVDELQVYDRSLAPIEAAQLADGRSLTALLNRPAEQLDDEALEQLRTYYLASCDAAHREAVAQLRELRHRRSRVVDPIPELMVMQEMMPPRETYLLERGAYDAPGQRLEPGVPAGMLPLPEGAPANRLGLAQWLTDPHHPLTARVAVNRFWQTIFGRGLVATADDFGSQGQLPSHPELLDWLAKSFIDSGWDVKQLVKQMVMSATYRQSSDCSPEVRARDPDNELLARGPRYRWPAEMIRDNALLAGGLLVDRIGGPPVKPYQPEGLWEEKSGARYQRDEGEGSHRRSLYTFWKRTSPPPDMLTLDAAKREVCVVQRQTTSTPLQALVLLNDPHYVEAARGLAERAMHQGEDLPGRLSWMFRVLTSRSAHSQELAVLISLYEGQLAQFSTDPAAAESLLQVGDHRHDPQLDAAQLAALAIVAGALLNHDETVTKR